MSDQPIAFITVRTGSKRLPKKCLLPFGKGNVLEHIISRTRHYNIEPIVCTTELPEDTVISDISSSLEVRCFRGSVHNKLKRWKDCCDAFDIEEFHTIDADDPFFDGKMVRKSMKLLSKGYDLVYPTKTSSRGAASVGFSISKQAIIRATPRHDSVDTEMCWHYFDRDKYIKKIVLPDKKDSILIRLTLDYLEDYWLLCIVQKMVGSFASRKKVEDLFRRNPDLYKINWFRNEEWKRGQVER